MCDHEELYEYFPAMTIGGQAGDYFIPTPTQSNRWTEFSIVAIMNGDGGAGSVVISGNSKPKAVLIDGSLALSNDNHIKGQVYRIGSTTTLIFPGDVYERVTNSERKVFVRIDPAANSSLYVSIRFRNRLITKIPGPQHTGDPHNMQHLNAARADATNARLGLDKEIHEGEGLNAIRQK